MAPLILIAAMLLAPAVILFLLRANAALVFLSLCLGSILVRFVGPDAQSFVGLFTKSQNISHSTIQLGLLFLPVVVTSLVMIRSVRGLPRALMNVIPSLAVGLVGLLLAEPYLPGGIQHSLIQTSVWHQLLRGQDLVVGVSALIGLLFLWLQRPRSQTKEEGGRRKH